MADQVVEIKEEAAFEDIGSTGLKRSNGFVLEEWLLQLRGRRAMEVYREMMDNNAVIGGILYAIESFIREVDWRVEPADESESAQAAAKFLEECMVDMSHTWEDFISEILTMLPFGWAYHEEVYKRRIGPDEEDPSRRSKFKDGRIGWRKLPIRSQETLWKWEFDDDGGIRGMWQNDPWRPGGFKGNVFIPIEKALLFRTKLWRNNPEGRSILRNAYKSYYYLKRIQAIEAIGIERDLAGLPVAKVPVEAMTKSASPAMKEIRQIFEKMVVQVRNDERAGLVIPHETDAAGNPTGYGFELLSTGGSRTFDVNAVIERYEHRIATTVLHDWILLGQDKVGSFALASTKTQASAIATVALLDSMTAVINRFAIPRLFRLNPEFPQEVWPTLVHGDIEVPDLTKIGDYVMKLVGAGALQPDDALERHLRQAASFPIADAEPDLTPMLVTPPSVQNPGVAPEPKPEDGGMLTVPAEFNPTAQAKALFEVLDIVEKVEAGAFTEQEGVGTIIGKIGISKEQAQQVLKAALETGPAGKGNSE